MAWFPWFGRSRVRPTPRRGAARPRLRLEQLEAIITPMGVPLYAVATGQGVGPQVKVYNADGSLRFDFFAYDTRFTGGVRVATGDLTGDGLHDIITVPGINGGPHVRVFDGAATGTAVPTLIREFNAYDPNFRGGVFIALADVTGDTRADIIT